MLRMQKGKKAGLKYSGARMTGIALSRLEKRDRPSVRIRNLKLGYSGWKRAWVRWKPSAFELRFSSIVGDFGIWQLPVRHPFIRFEGA